MKRSRTFGRDCAGTPKMSDDLPVGADDRRGDERPERSKKFEVTHGTRSIFEKTT